MCCTQTGRVFAWGWAGMSQIGTPMPADVPKRLVARVPSAACHRAQSREGAPAVLLSAQHADAMQTATGWVLPAIQRSTIAQESALQAVCAGPSSAAREAVALETDTIEPHGLCVLAPAELVVFGTDGVQLGPAAGVDASEWHTVIVFRPSGP